MHARLTARLPRAQVWAISCTSYVAIVCYKGLFVVRIVYAAAAWALCAIVHALSTCERLDVQHQVVRTLLYYISCTLFFYHRHSPAITDRGSFHLSVVHVFYHVFFVQHYVLLGSVLVAGLVFGAAYYAEHAARLRGAHAPPWRPAAAADCSQKGSGEWRAAGPSEWRATKTDAKADAADMETLRELRAAQQHHSGVA